MAIKLPDPGNGIPEQKTGNDEWTNMKIVRENFADQSNAASRLVGAENGQLPQAQDIRNLAFGSTVKDNITGSVSGYEGGILFANVDVTDKPPLTFATVLTFQGYTNTRLQLCMPYNDNLDKFYIRARPYNPSGISDYQPWGLIYTSQNTTREPGTGYIKTSSPVLHLLHNNFEKIHEAKQLDIKVENPKTGVYKITGTTGLRKNDGWYFSPPKDEHNNVLCMVEVGEAGDVVTVKTYKKKFDFETVSIVPDYNNPTNIPEGAIVMLRFNDLPQEQLDEPTI